MANDAVASLAEPSTQRSRVLGGKYLTFKLGDEEYGLEILRVREIIGLMPITAVPRTPEAVRGVINLRGKIIPVLDLRQKFGMGRVEDTELTCVIVVDADVKGLPAQMGLLVDSVSEVVDVLDDQVEEAPSFGEGLDTSFLLGMAKHRGAVKILLNTEAVLSEPGVVDIATSMSPDLARSQDSSDGEG
jgi:purine-binding chemotaxis protein CheW